MHGQAGNGIKMCFASIYQNDKMCRLGCQTEDTLEHIFECETLNSAKTPSLEAVFGSVTNQKEAAAALIIGWPQAEVFMKPTTQVLLRGPDVLEGLQPVCKYLNVNKITIFFVSPFQKQQYSLCKSKLNLNQSLSSNRVLPSKLGDQTDSPHPASQLP